eukprot:1925464-Amphidinium_carterae.2
MPVSNFHLLLETLGVQQRDPQHGENFVRRGPSLMVGAPTGKGIGRHTQAIGRAIQQVKIVDCRWTTAQAKLLLQSTKVQAVANLGQKQQLAGVLTSEARL